MSGYERSSGYDRGEVARRNDVFRRSGDLHDFLLAPGAMFLPDLPGVLQAVRDYDGFTRDNDPRGEHDFGSLDWYGEPLYWMITYDIDPLDDNCHRELLVMTLEDC